jgi:hypothetical protein
MLERHFWKISALLFLMAAFFGLSPTWADTPPCYPWDSSAKALQLSTVPEAKFDWMAADPAEASYTVTWFCDIKYQWKAVGFVGWKAELIPDWFATAVSFRKADKTTLDTAWNQYIKCPDVTLTTPECLPYARLNQIIQRQYAATRPLPIVWQVKDNPTATTRPVFPVSATGTRTTVATGERVSDVATVCDCVTKAIEETGGTYCSVSGLRNQASPDPAAVIAPDRVALCGRIN